MELVINNELNNLQLQQTFSVHRLLYPDNTYPYAPLTIHITIDSHLSYDNGSSSI